MIFGLDAAISILASVFVIAIFVYGLQRGWFVLEMDRRLQANVREDYTRLAYLLDEAKLERNQLLEELAEANRKLKQLEASDVSLRQRISELEADLAKYQAAAVLPVTPLLLVCGDDSFGKTDAEQLTRSRIWYRTLEHATAGDVEAEMARRRQNGDMYWWVHISAHGSEAGILLADGLKTPDWWQNQLTGVSVLVCANCASVAVGDVMAGLVEAVVVFYGDRESSDIAQFTYLFWSEMLHSNDVHAAYKKALLGVPALRAFVDLRVH